MKILQVASGDFFSTYGGGQVYVKNIVDELLRQRPGSQCVISFVSNHDRVDQKIYNGCPLYEIGLGREKDIPDIVRSLNPTAIHAHSHKDLMCQIGESLDIPVIVTAHHGGIVCPAGTLLDMDDSICSHQVCLRNCLRCCLRNIRTGCYWYPLVKHIPEKSFVKIGKFLTGKPFIPFITPIGGVALCIEGKRKQWRTIVDKCTLMIAPSRKMGEAMTMRGLNEDKLKIVAHGIPRPSVVTPISSIDGKIKFFYVGRICYVKGIHILLKAFSKLNSDCVELHLIGTAANKAENHYMTKLRKLYAQDTRIIWHGKVAPSEVYDTIKDFHASSSAAFLESFGLNIAESLAMGKPVIATRCGGAEMQIKDGVNGWLVPTNDPIAMCKAFEYVVDHPETLVIMADQCRNSVKYLDEHCRELITIYSEYEKK